MVLLSSERRNEFLAPGELTSHHAQLISRTEATNRCASCHAAGNQTISEWLRHAFDDELAQPSQTDLCMECHREQFSSEAARWAHNIQPDRLLSEGGKESILSADRRSVDPTQPLECRACHREHHGADHNLTFLSDAACQSCHAETYHSFGSDHPEFAQWPSSRRTRIVFDHASHEAKHFDKQKTEFACSLCHELDQSGAFQRTLSYEVSCAGCHDEDLANSWTSGLAVFSLPMLDTNALADAEKSIGSWPAEAADEFDGPLPTITKLLIASDERALQGLKLLGAEFDFFDVDPDDPQQLVAAADVVWATKELYHDLAAEGQLAIKMRLESILQRELSAGELSDLTARVTPESLGPITGRWLKNLSAEIAKRRDTEPEKPACKRGDVAPRPRTSTPKGECGWLVHRRFDAGRALSTDWPCRSVRHQLVGSTCRSVEGTAFCSRRTAAASADVADRPRAVRQLP